MTVTHAEAARACRATAAWVLTDPANKASATLARTHDGDLVAPSAPTATHFCALGYLARQLGVVTSITEIMQILGLYDGGAYQRDPLNAIWANWDMAAMRTGRECKHHLLLCAEALISHAQRLEAAAGIPPAMPAEPLVFPSHWTRAKTLALTILTLGVLR